MKKTTLFAFAAFVAAASFTSCKKDYTCECKDSAGTITNIPLKDAKKTEATDACNVSDAFYKLGGGSCTLK
jgi:hypothetical protein